MQNGSGDSLLDLSADVLSKHPDFSQNWYHLFSKSFGLKVLSRPLESTVLSVVEDIKFFFYVKVIG